MEFNIVSQGIQSDEDETPAWVRMIQEVQSKREKTMDQMPTTDQQHSSLEMIFQKSSSIIDLNSIEQKQGPEKSENTGK